MKKIIILLLFCSPMIVRGQQNKIAKSTLRVDSFYFDKSYQINSSSVRNLIVALNDSIKLTKKYTSTSNTEADMFCESLNNCYQMSKKCTNLIKALVFCRYKYAQNDETGVDFYELHFTTSREAESFFTEIKKKKRKVECTYPWIPTTYIALSENRIFYVKDIQELEEKQIDDLANLLEKSINITKSSIK